MKKIPRIAVLFAIIISAIFLTIGMILVGWMVFDIFGAIGFFLYVAMLFYYGFVVLFMIICE